MKEVFKPWGKEVWLELNDRYCYKRIYLNAGTKTSYQYHQHKLETNYIISGEAEIWLEDDNGVVQKTLMGTDGHFTVLPFKKHRVVAITDVVLQEVSTPEVDDVIRIEDDFSRDNGKILEEHMKPAICILTAGKGTRLEKYSEFINKALLPIDNKAAITHIIEQVPIDFEIVVVLGYKANMVREYCEIAHPERTFTFIMDDEYGAGPGKSILKAKDVLQRPFYFVTVDTILTEPLTSIRDNWLGVAPTAMPELYSTVYEEHGQVEEFKNKGANGYDKAFIGLASIHDFNIFWDELDVTHGEIVTAFYDPQAYNGLSTRTFDWFDIGTLDSYLMVKAIFESGDKYSIPKTNGEFLYRVGNQFIKLFTDTDAISNRIIRSHILEGFVPKLTNSGRYMYAYGWIPGETLYHHDASTWQMFLDKCQEKLWKPDNADISHATRKFYRDKTFKRFDMFMENRNESYLMAHNVNGEMTLPIHDLLDSIPWDDLINNYISVQKFHGDLQFDNIILSDDGSFVGLDWRHDFGGITNSGDVYYDLAKLYGGLLMPYDKIKDEKSYSLVRTPAQIKFTHATDDSLLKFVELFKVWLDIENYDFERVRLITALIYLNMAPLHEEILGNVLFFKSKLMLQGIYNDKQGH
jgi:choline kinase/mannose-6-phosphate isomerase-like protein (cupin superfamily)